MNDTPLLEYDPCPDALVRPGREYPDLTLPDRAVFAFLGEEVDRCANEYSMTAAAHYESVMKPFPIYVGETDGVPFVLAEAPVGAPAAAMLLDWLLSLGVKTVIAVGSCGCLTDLPENAFLLPRDALRDEGTSYHYLPPARLIGTDPRVREAMKKVLSEKKIPFAECRTWTTDGFFRETAEKTARRIEEGCECVEMECAALAACAAFRGAHFAQLLYTADSLANLTHDDRDWGAASVAPALRLCIGMIGKV